ncbi:MAG: DUF4476 domain-containing protein [Chitinophagaceae bacterium]|nr:DUF4476 domain-containing protein [Chitinophagaceae bacterium]
MKKLANCLLAAIICLVLIIGIGQVAHAQAVSYIYIEGVQGIPFKISLNQVEKNILGKNYILLPTNQVGENKVEIRFNGDLYPAQEFVIDVREHASYGYKLAKAGDQRFYLIDLINNGKIIETNSNVNIGLTTELNHLNFDQASKLTGTKSKKDKKQQLKPATEVEQANLPKENQEAIELNISKKEKRRQEKLAEAKVAQAEADKLALEKAAKQVEKDKQRQEKANNPEPSAKEKKRKQKEEALAAESLAKQQEEASKEEKLGVIEVIKSKESKETELVNEKVSQSTTKASHCPTNASDNEVNYFLDKLNQKSDDEAKIILIKKKIFTGCLTAAQLNVLAESLDTQYGRFTLVKFLKTEISNPEDLIMLEPLFKYESYRSKLRKLASE